MTRYVFCQSNVKEPLRSRDLMWSLCHPDQLQGEGSSMMMMLMMMMIVMMMMMMEMMMTMMLMMNMMMEMMIIIMMWLLIMMIMSVDNVYDDVDANNHHSSQ